MGLKSKPKKIPRVFNKTHKKSFDQKLTLKKSHAEFLSLENLQKGKQVCRLNFNRRTGTEHYQESSDCCCSYLKPPQKTLDKFYYLTKILDRNFFWRGWGGGGAFWSENGSRLSLSGMVFEGTTGVYERIYHFCFKCLRKKEKYANSKWILKHFFCYCSKLSTVMIRFSTGGAYLLLVPKGRALISLLRNNRMLKTKL